MKVVHHGGPTGNPRPPDQPPGAQAYPTSNPFSLGHDAKPILKQNIRIDINRPANDHSDFPMRALIRDMLQELQKADPTTMILPMDESSTDGALTMESDIPTGRGVTKYFGGFQDAPGKANKSTKVIRVFVRISSHQSLRDLKRHTGVYGWLKQNNFFMRVHGFSTSYDVVSAGFISKMSPTLHRRDTVNAIIQTFVKTSAHNIELRLVPNRIPNGKADDKRYTTAVEIQVDRQHLQKTRELMIELFETNTSELPNEVYFVPSPTNGTMPYELYYQHLRMHHEHVANLRSFAITNVGDLQAAMTFTNPDDTTDTRTTTFEAELMNQTKAGTTEKLIYSIEPTQSSETEGRYLLVTHKDTIAEAEKFIDYALQHLTNNTPDNMAKIMRAHAPVTRTNRIPTSDRFQSYASKLHSMIPTTISTSVPIVNAWKRRPPTSVNLTDDDFPAMDTPKKQRTNDPAAVPDTATTTDTTESLTTIDLDEIEKAQNELKENLSKEIAAMREETSRMQTTLQEQFTTAMQQLEIRLETNTQRMFNDLGRSLTQAVENMNAQAARGDALLQNFKTEAMQLNNSLLQSIDAKLSGLRPNKRDRSNNLWENLRNDDNDSDDDSENGNMDDDDYAYEQDRKQRRAHMKQADLDIAVKNYLENPKADGSHNPNASRANHPKNGMDTSTGGIE